MISAIVSDPLALRRSYLSVPALDVLELAIRVAMRQEGRRPTG